MKSTFAVVAMERLGLPWQKLGFEKLQISYQTSFKKLQFSARVRNSLSEHPQAAGHYFWQVSRFAAWYAPGIIFAKFRAPRADGRQELILPSSALRGLTADCHLGASEST